MTAQAMLPWRTPFCPGQVRVFGSFKLCDLTTPNPRRNVTRTRTILTSDNAWTVGWMDYHPDRGWRFMAGYVARDYAMLPHCALVLLQKFIRIFGTENSTI